MRNLSPLALTLTCGLFAVACSSSTPNGGSGTGGSSTGSGGHATGGSTGSSGGSTGSSGGSTGSSGGSTGSSGGSTGSSGGSTGSSGGSTGSGGVTASGGATGSGGNHGGISGSTGSSGGSTGSGGAGGNHATGGTTGSGGSTGSGGAGGTTTGTGGTGSCPGLALCDTFESSTVGGPPNSTLWTIINGSDGAVTVDSIGAHGSSKSLKVAASQRLYIRNSNVINTLGPDVHVRFYLRLMMALPANHGAMMTIHPKPVDQYAQDPEFRFGSQDAVFHWNNTQGDVNVPTVSPDGDALSFKPQPSTWYCVELTISPSTGNFSASIDGNTVAGLVNDGVKTPNIDDSWLSTANVTSTYSTLADFNLGWASYGAGAMTLWFDDIALSSSPIGCAN